MEKQIIPPRKRRGGIDMNYYEFCEKFTKSPFEYYQIVESDSMGIRSRVHGNFKELLRASEAVMLKIKDVYSQSPVYSNIFNYKLGQVNESGCIPVLYKDSSTNKWEVTEFFIQKVSFSWVE